MIAPPLVAEGLVRHYDEVRALDGFDLIAQPGEIVGLLGANGSGKTTFVETVTGLVRPTAGRVEVCGVDMLRNPRQARRHLGCAPQDVAMYYSATVKENLLVFGGLVGLRGPALRSAMDEVTGQMRLESVMDKQVGVLSGGQRRRAQVATALLGKPSLLLLDEPTAGADPPTREALLTAVRARAAEGAAVIYTTHYLPELSDLDASLAVIRAGKVIARGEQDSLLAGLMGEVKVRLDGPIPDRLRDLGRVENDELHLPSIDPAQTLAGLLADGLVPLSVDVRKPSLDDLYESLEMVTNAG
jgi:ABC-2 type transport system ATP-binding protein